MPSRSQTRMWLSLPAAARIRPSAEKAIRGSPDDRPSRCEGHTMRELALNNLRPIISEFHQGFLTENPGNDVLVQVVVSQEPRPAHCALA
jgi:hypothetical protein